MRNIKNTLILSGLVLLSTSCETPQEGFQSVYQSTAAASADSTPEGRRAFDSLTNGGRTLPAVQDVTRIVNSPGDLPTGGDCAPSGVIPKAVPVVSTNGKSPFRRNVNPSGKDPGYGISLKNHPRPERGCYPIENVSLEKAKQAIASQNFSMTSDSKSKDASSTEMRTLGAAILSMQYLNGGVFQIGRPSRTMPFEMCDDKSKSSQQFGSKFRISRKGNAQHGLSVAQYVHEWGHLIGNSPMPGGGGNVYSAFLSAIGGKVRTEDSGGGQAPCLVSRYADNRSNEHFAEVLTAFVTEPSILLNNKGPGAKACKKAYDFFEKKLFKKGSRARECM